VGQSSRSSTGKPLSRRFWLGKARTVVSIEFFERMGGERDRPRLTALIDGRCREPLRQYGTLARMKGSGRNARMSPSRVCKACCRARDHRFMALSRRRQRDLGSCHSQHSVGYLPSNGGESAARSLTARSLRARGRWLHSLVRPTGTESACLRAHTAPRVCGVTSQPGPGIGDRSQVGSQPIVF
jgi:hypothetical protein